MKLYGNLEEASRALTRSVVTIGNFDGVHIGHQHICQRARSLAVELDAEAVLLTFDPHPVAYFRPGAPTFRLSTVAQKAEAVAAQGIDAMVTLGFDGAMASLDARQFVEQILVQGLKAKAVVVGWDFGFGRARQGTVEVLKSLGEELGFAVEICPAFVLDGRAVSSTRVRETLATAQMDEVARLLGRPYEVRGEVVHGDERGRHLGFPTANVLPQDTVLPPDGVYATSLETPAGQSFQAITNIGLRPTFGGDRRVIETFVLDAPDEPLDLYGQEVRLGIAHHVRAEQKFASPQELVTQIQRDIAHVRQWFAAFG